MDVQMFLQHWATCRRPSVEQTIGAAREPPLINPIPEQLRVYSYWCNNVVTLIKRSEWSVFAVYSVICCEQTCWHNDIRIGNSACFFFFSALTFFYIFVFYFRSVGYIASYKFDFHNWQNLKFSSQGAALNSILHVLCAVNGGIIFFLFEREYFFFSNRNWPHDVNETLNERRNNVVWSVG